ncbi:MAG: acyltransferase [Bacteroidales bacterium]|nr:acyltransferase [Candidatus Physcocola equi]
MKQRIDSLDIAKALCIILVVIGHFNPDNAPVFWKWVNSIIYSFHMPLFLFVSGMVYHHTYKKRSCTSFIGKKLKRLAVPYLITSAIIITIKLVSQGNAQIDNPVSLYSFIEMFYLPSAGYFLWFIWVLMLIFVIIWFAKSKTSRTILFCISIALYYIPVKFPEVFCLRQLKVMMIFFMMGVMFSEYKMKVILQNTTANIMFVLLFGVAYYLWGKSGDNLVPIVAFVGILAILSISKWLERISSLKSKVLLPLAATSYTVYLFHTTFMGFAKAVVTKLNWDNTMFWTEALAVTLCGIIAPYILHQILQHTKSGRIVLGIS